MKPAVLLLEDFERTLERRWIRAMLLLGIILVPLFGALDAVIAPPAVLHLFLSIRLLATLSCIIQYYILIRFTRKKRIVIHTYVFTFVVGGIISFMTTQLGGFESGYYAGLILVLITVNLFLPWRLWQGIINGILIVAPYLALNLLMTSNWRLADITSNLFFVLTALVITYAVAYNKHRLLLSLLLDADRKSKTDPKTGLLKYRTELLEQIIRMVGRFRDSLQDDHRFSIAYLRIDIDDFSHKNNAYGHAFGDEILVALARKIRKTVRPADYAIRFGGEEFDVILPYTDIAGARRAAERIMEGIRGLEFMRQGARIELTVSMGLSVTKIDMTQYLLAPKNKIFLDGTIQQLLILQKQADDACYDAKLAGKNRISEFSSEKEYDQIRREYAANPSEPRQFTEKPA